MDDESLPTKILTQNDSKKSNCHQLLAALKLQKLQPNRSASLLFSGVAVGLVLSFLFANSGYFDEETTEFDNSLQEAFA